MQAEELILAVMILGVPAFGALERILGGFWRLYFSSGQFLSNNLNEVVVG